MANIGYTNDTALYEWALARGIELSGCPDALLTRALDWLEVQRFAGNKTDPAQLLQWPRTGARIDGTLIATDEVPSEVAELQLRIAVDIDAGMSPDGQRKASKSSAAVAGAVAVTYQAGESDSRISSHAQALLNKLSGSRGGFNQFEVRRG